MQTDETSLDSAAEIHLSASVSDTDSHSEQHLDSYSTPTMDDLKDSNEPIMQDVLSVSSEQSIQTDNDTEKVPQVVHVRIDLLPNLQMILFYLIMIFTMTYSIYRIVTVFSHIIPVEFFFMTLIGIFGFINFDSGRSPFLLF